MTTPDPRDRNHDGHVSASEAAVSALYRHVPHPHIAARRKQGPVKVADEHVGWNGRIAVAITRRFGSMAALYVLIGWMLGWMLLAGLGMPLFRSDPYPFVFLLFLSNLVQLWALPVLAVGQQVLGQAADKRAEQTFEDAEAVLHEAMQIQQHLAVQDAALQAQDKVLAELVTHVKGAAAPTTEGTKL